VAPLPLDLPIAPTIDRRAVQVRAFERVELVVGEVQRRPEFVGRRERVEVRRVNEGVVTAGERRRYMLANCADAISERGKRKGYFTCFGLLSNGSRCT